MIKAAIYYSLVIYTTIWAVFLSSMVEMVCIIFSLDKTKKRAYWYRRIYAFHMATILNLLGVEICYSGTVGNGKTIWISNHRSKLDGLWLQVFLCIYHDTLSVAKKEVQYYPFFGIFGRFCQTIFINRRIAFAETEIKNYASRSDISSHSILIFPEGKTMSADSKRVSDDFASRQNINKLENVLIPKTTGFKMFKMLMQYDTIGDITLRYPDLPKGLEHSFLDLFKIFPQKVELKIEYPDIESDLYNLFEKKDRDLANWKINTQNKMSDMISVKKFICIANYIILSLLLYSSPIPQTIFFTLVAIQLIHTSISLLFCKV